MNFVLAWLAALTLLAFILLWLVSFPEKRALLTDRLKRGGLHITTHTSRTAQKLDAKIQRGGQGAHQLAGAIGHFVQRHRWPITMVCGVLLIPTLLVLGLRQHIDMQAYDTNAAVNQNTVALVTSLLEGDQLSPPAPLPPATFVTDLVELEAPERHLGQANRDWDRLNSQFRQRLLAVFKVMQQRYGYKMVMIEGYRSPQRQAQLASKGSNVTNAGAWQSYHQFGLAADCAFYHHGKLVIAAKTPWVKRGYRLYGKVAQAAGLVWGGSWESIRDLGHVELHLPGHGPAAYRKRLAQQNSQ